MSNTSSTLPSTLSIVQEKLTFFVLPSYVILGLLGNAFCIVYFLQKSQRSSSCAFYLLLAAIVNTLAVSFGITTNILNAWKALASTSLVYCKSRMYINHTLIFIGRMYTILATIDTYTMSSTRPACRNFSQRSTAIKCALGVLVACPLIAVHIPIMNTLVNGQCVMTGVYSLIFAIYQMFVAGIMPPVLMIIFSCLAYSNLKQATFVRDDRQDRRKKQQQRQLVRMVAVQVTVYIISAELVPITTLYRQLTASVTGKSTDQRAIESFVIFFASNLLLYLNTWAAFFIYLVTSNNFRVAFIRLFHKTYRVQPMTTMIGERTATAQWESRAVWPDFLEHSVIQRTRVMSEKGKTNLQT